MTQPDLAPASAFTGLKKLESNGLGVAVRERDGLRLCTVLERRGKAAELAARMQDRFGIEPPSQPRRVSAGALSLLGTGPGAWLAVSENGGNTFASALRDAMGDVASVSDQGDGLAVVRLTGMKVREALGKLFAIDLDASVFEVGHVAVSPAGHIGATLWRLDDDPKGSSVFEIAVHRSFAASFEEHLLEAAAEFGVAYQ